MAVRAAAELCDAELSGAAEGSVILDFHPRKEVTGGDFRFDIGTAGSTTMVAQTVLVPLAHAERESTVWIKGGTHNPHAPTTDYLENVYLPALTRMGIDVDFSSPTSGYYPIGGGEVNLHIRPSRPAPIMLTSRGRVKRLEAVVTTSSLPVSVGTRGARQVGQKLPNCKVSTMDKPSPSTGASVLVYCEFEGGFGGFTGLGKRGKPMEEVAYEPCIEFKNWSKCDACVDEHLADQLVLPLSLAKGESRWTTEVVTDHLRTVLWLVEQFLPVASTVDELAEKLFEVRLKA